MLFEFIKYLMFEKGKEKINMVDVKEVEYYLMEKRLTLLLEGLGCQYIEEVWIKQPPEVFLELGSCIQEKVNGKSVDEINPHGRLREIMIRVEY
jgi:hypothetical protein